MSESSEQAREFHLPDLGEGIREAEVISCLVEAGAHVVADQPIIVVETDKAIVELPAPFSGRIVSLDVSPGDQIEVGALLATFMVETTSSVSGAAGIVGDLPEAPTQPEVIHPAQPAATTQASPRARQRARELGIDLAAVEGSGPEGVIQTFDVEQADSSGGRVLSGVRRAMAKRMAEAGARVVRATVTGEADISRWQADASTIARLIRAMGSACSAQPLLNAHFDDEAMRLTPKPQVDLGIAMETEDGLFVPVLRDINHRKPQALQADLENLKQAVRARSIKPDALRGQTITLSNFGVIGGLFAEMVVIPPQVAIVGAGRAFPRAALENGELTEKTILPLSITFDHRALTGAETCLFLEALRHDLEKPN